MGFLRWVVYGSCGVLAASSINYHIRECPQLAIPKGSIIDQHGKDTDYKDAYVTELPKGVRFIIAMQQVM